MFYKRIVLLGLCLWASLGLCAFTLQYGSLFKVADITLTQEGKPVLPLARGKYANIRVLTKETFEILKKCPASCRQTAGKGDISLHSFRPAQTRPGMWIAEVSYDEAWLVTFLIFQNKEGFGVVPPEHFIFLDKALQARTERLLSARAQEEK